MDKANPTIETQNRIIEVIENSNKPISLTAISKLSKKGFNEVKASVNFLTRLGVLDLIISSGNSTFVILKKESEDTKK
jgi:phage FluMu protein gp41